MRLFKELEARNRDLTETLEQQTATGEILRVISSSPTDVQPVFDTIAQSAARLCEGVRMWSSPLRWRAPPPRGPSRTIAPAVLEVVQRRLPDAAATAGPAAGARSWHGAVAQIADVHADPDVRAARSRARRACRSVLAVPMIRDGVPIGAIVVTRAEAGLFSERQIELLKTFADQAVIAVENVRLFKELEARNRDLTETLEQQTATGEILRVISSSPTDVQPVFDTIARECRRLCDADSGSVFTLRRQPGPPGSLDNTSPERSDALRGVYPLGPTLETVGGRAILDRADPFTSPTCGTTPATSCPTPAGRGASRACCACPCSAMDSPVGIIIVRTWETPRPFTRTQIDLLKTFADQAVIAIENVRLFTELEARNRELTETLEQQTATGEILRVISSSPTDIQPVFDTVAESAARLCERIRCEHLPPRRRAGSVSSPITDRSPARAHR